jgi:WD40 repeat protein
MKENERLFASDVEKNSNDTISPDQPVSQSTPPAARKRPLRLVLERALAALLLVGLLFGWLVSTQHLHFPASPLRPVSIPARAALPPIQPGKLLFTYQGQNIATSWWSADSRYLGFSNDNATARGQYVNGGEHIYAWDARSMKLAQTMILPSLPAGSQGGFFLGPDRYLVLTSNQGLLQIWDSVNARKILSLNITGGYPQVTWSNDNKRIALNNLSDGQVEIWDLASASRIEAYPLPLPDSFELWWSPDNRYLASGSNARVMTVWDAFTGKVVLTVSNYDVAQITWAPDSRRLLVDMPAEKQMQIWDVPTNKLLVTSPNFSFNPVWTNDGTHIILQERDKWLIWDAHTGHTSLTLPSPLSDTLFFPSPLLSNDKRDILVKTDSNDVQVWDITTGQDVLTYRGIPAGAIILATSWSPDNKSIASLDSDGLLLIWSPLTGQTLHAYRIPPLATPGLMWSPDGKQLALSGGQNILEVLQVDG